MEEKSLKRERNSESMGRLVQPMDMASVRGENKKVEDLKKRFREIEKRLQRLDLLENQIRRTEDRNLLKDVLRVVGRLRDIEERRLERHKRERSRSPSSRPASRFEFPSKEDTRGDTNSSTAPPENVRDGVKVRDQGAPAPSSSPQIPQLESRNSPTFQSFTETYRPQRGLPKKSNPRSSGTKSHANLRMRAW